MDLSDFLSRDERFGKFVHNKTFYRALQSLASAIHSVHNFAIDGEVSLKLIIYHHDLRPANVLVTPDTFMLADFGLSGMKTTDKESKSEWKDTMGDYIAPECMNDDFQSQDVGRGIDIWAFGCLLVEVVTYMEQGADGVKAARDARFRAVSGKWNVKNSYFWLEQSVRPEVRHHMEALRHNASLGTRGVLEVAESLLAVDAYSRPGSEASWKMMASVTTQWSYAEVEAALNEYEVMLRSKGYTYPFALDLWFEKRKLHIWGKAFSQDVKTLVDENNTDGLGAEVMASSQEVLEELQTLLIHSRAQLSELDGDQKPESAPGFQPTVSSEVRKKVEKLISLVPVDVVRQLNHMCEEDIINTMDIKLLGQERSVEALESEQHRQLASMALLRDLKTSLTKIDSAAGKDLQLRNDMIKQPIQLTDGLQEIAWFHLYPTDSEGSTNACRVLVERVPYSDSWLKRTPNERAERIAALANLLAQNKPDALRVLDCIGYQAPDEEGYSLVFRFPTDDAKIIPETLLGHLRKATQKPKRGGLSRVPEKPPLEARFRLALDLAKSIHALHSIGWLHKALNSANVLFFPKPEDYGKAILSEPYLVDFRFSRPDGTSSFTDGPATATGGQPFVDYVHPDYLAQRRQDLEDDSWNGDDENESSKRRFRKLYDHYSLGIIMLEIAYWNPIAEILRQCSTLSPNEIRTILLTKYIPRLQSTMGRLYMEATKACVEGTIDETGDVSLEPGTRGFHTCVIEQLSKINVG